MTSIKFLVSSANANNPKDLDPDSMAPKTWINPIHNHGSWGILGLLNKGTTFFTEVNTCWMDPPGKLGSPARVHIPQLCMWAAGRQGGVWVIELTWESWHRKSISWWLPNHPEYGVETTWKHISLKPPISIWYDSKYRFHHQIHSNSVFLFWAFSGAHFSDKFLEIEMSGFPASHGWFPEMGNHHISPDISPTCYRAHTHLAIIPKKIIQSYFNRDHPWSWLQVSNMYLKHSPKQAYPNIFAGCTIRRLHLSNCKTYSNTWTRSSNPRPSWAPALSILILVIICKYIRTHAISRICIAKIV